MSRGSPVRQASDDGDDGTTMLECRCELLNVMSGDVARDYARGHLEEVRTDGMGRPVLRCDQTGLEWVEEGTGAGYGDDVVMLRRAKG